MMSPTHGGSCFRLALGCALRGRAMTMAITQAQPADGDGSNARPAIFISHASPEDNAPNWRRSILLVEALILATRAGPIVSREDFLGGLLDKGVALI
jgi:hypothetical protein